MALGQLTRMTEEAPRPRWTLGDLATDPEKSVNGVSVPIPGKDGLFATIVQSTAARLTEFSERYPEEKREELGWDDEEALRAFVGECILRDLSPLYDEDGEPVTFTPEMGRDMMLDSKTVTDSRTGEKVKVFRHEWLYQFVWQRSTSTETFAESVAGN